MLIRIQKIQEESIENTYEGEENTAMAKRIRQKSGKKKILQALFYFCVPPATVRLRREGGGGDKTMMDGLNRFGFNHRTVGNGSYIAIVKKACHVIKS